MWDSIRPWSPHQQGGPKSPGESEQHRYAGNFIENLPDELLFIVLSYVSATILANINCISKGGDISRSKS